MSRAASVPKPWTTADDSMAGGPTPLPEATYRLQFHAGFTFRDAAALVPYLAALGITHVYASPILKARPGSTHGYDVIDPCALNPELGSQADFDGLCAALRAAGLYLIVDVVPNHIGVNTNENAWWNDLLEHGPASRYARFFDITWSGSPRPELHGRVLLPVLADPYGRALEAGELRLAFHSAGGAFFVRYHDSRFPVSPRSYCRLLAGAAAAMDEPTASAAAHHAAAEVRLIIQACRELPDRCDRADAELRAAATAWIKERLADLCHRSPETCRQVDLAVQVINGRPGDPRSFDGLDLLLSKQNYRLAHWRTAAEEINYRRFFDVNDLAALAMQRPEVFDATHRFIFGLFESGKLAGLRIDHPDGLFDPAGYFRRLQDRYAAVAGHAEPAAAAAPDARRPLYVVVEKILALDESLPDAWPVHGTTGYDFLNRVNGLFVNADASAALTRFYHDWTGDPTSFDELAYRSKRLILDRSLAGELRMLAHGLDRLAQRHRHSRDFTPAGLTAALREVIACFPVYRTYVGEHWATRAADTARIDAAVGLAGQHTPGLEEGTLEFLRDTLLLRYGGDDAGPALRAAQRQFAGRFQQVTAAVTAKGTEDTAFWVYGRLLSLNEVGGDPAQFGVAPEDLHRYFADRRRRWPHALSTLSTHDTKRSEDVRARLNVLSEMPEEWPRQVARWSELNAPHRSTVNGSAVPDHGLEYTIYQRLLGAWPLEASTCDGGAAPEEFVRRVHACTVKALRESKLYSDWLDPDEALESAVLQFLGAILDPARGSAFLAEFLPFRRRVAHFGMINSLAQTLLKLTAPGVPDTYQGTETWNFSLVDPDNRRPVDYEALRGAMADVEAVAERPGGGLTDGRLKQLLHVRALAERRARPGLFTEGEYVPAAVEGPAARHAFAFARRHGGVTAVTIVPRLPVTMGLADGDLPLGKRAWKETAVRLPGPAPDRWRDALAGRRCPATADANGIRIPIADALQSLPVALLLSE